MPRKRKTAETTTATENTSATAVIEPPKEIVVWTPPAEPSSVEQPSAEQPPTFVGRLGERINRPAAPDPFLIALDNAAGVRLFENRRARVMAIKFDEKPSPAVIATVKEAGYRWNPEDRVWTHPVREDSAMSTRIDAELLYQEVRKMVRQYKGIATGQDIPF